jgi:hypothetical protein
VPCGGFAAQVEELLTILPTNNTTPTYFFSHHTGETRFFSEATTTTKQRITPQQVYLSTFFYFGRFFSFSESEG